MRICIKVTPKAKKNELLGWEEHPDAGRVLRIRISASPIEGQANKALISFLSKTLKTPQSTIRLCRGDTGRIKIIEIPDDLALFLREITKS